MRDWGEPKWMPKSGSFGVRLVKRTPIIANVFFFEVPTSNRWVRLFTEHSPHKRMLFVAPRLHVHTKIFLIFTSLVRHLHTDVDAARGERRTNHSCSVHSTNIDQSILKKMWCDLRNHTQSRKTSFGGKVIKSCWCGKYQFWVLNRSV